MTPLFGCLFVAYALLGKICVKLQRSSVGKVIKLVRVGSALLVVCLLEPPCFLPLVLKGLEEESVCSASDSVSMR